MARTHGRIQAAIWSDPDFIAMRGSAQRMFMFLLSQPDLSHAGLLPMRVNKWAKKAEDLTARTVRSELDYLDDRGFIVGDEDTEEVLIRTMVRNDGVYKQPLVMERMREDAKQIESETLRQAFARELDRLPLHELSTELSKNDGPSVRDRVERVVRQLREDFADSLEPSREAIERVTDTPHAGARPSPNHLPPTTDHQPPAEQDSRDESLETDPDLARFDEFWDTYAKKVDRKKAEAKWRLALKRVGVTPDLLIESARAYVTWERANNEGGRFVMDPARWLNGCRWEDERPARQAQGMSNVQQHLALARRLAAQEQDAPAIPFPQIGEHR